MMPIVNLTTAKTPGALLKAIVGDIQRHNDARDSGWDTNLVGDNRHDWTMFFEQLRSARPEIVKPYLHISVNFDPNEGAQRRLSDERILAFGKTYLEQMKLHDDNYDSENYQWLMAVRRIDDRIQLHILVNRIGWDLQLYNLWQSYWRFMAGLREVEKLYGFTPPKAPRKYHRPNRQGFSTWKAEAMDRIDEAIQATDGTWDGFARALVARQMDLRITTNGLGLTYCLLDRSDKQGQPIKLNASSLGMRYRMSALHERLEERARMSDPRIVRRFEDFREYLATLLRRL